ncbi:MAG: FAD-binding protein [Deltaproteobacteria bacterium]|nr:FAD-binding protein [Deltaproteobacteria bacterium]
MIQSIQTDVLVIGGGAAGVRAAIEARQRGCRVTMLSHSKIGRANNTAISFGGFAAALGQDNPEQHFQDTMNGGYWLNQPVLVRLLAEQVPSEVKNLETMGVHFQKHEDGTYIQVARGGHSAARRLTTETNSGVALIDPLLKYLDKMKVSRLEGLRAVRLLTADGTIQGVLAIDKLGEWHTVSARSVVLASGGGGALYPATTNVPSALGEGYALAFEAGLALRDMEFVQFVAVPQLGPGTPRRRLPPLEVFLLNGATLRNAKGEDLFELSGNSTFTRDVITRLIAQERLKDREEGYVKLDLSRVSSEKLGDMADFADLDIQVQTASHFFMGGIDVNKDLTTPIAGLFVAGEVMGGVHGANRLGGNALAETFVFGALAGDLAARFVEKNPKTRSFKPGLSEQAIEELNDFFQQGAALKKSEAKLPELETELKSIMGECASPVRNLDSLNEGLGRVIDLKDTLQSLAPPSPPELWPRTAFRNQLITAEMVLSSARVREESRGAHFRDDFPQSDNERWLVNVILQRDQREGMKHILKPVDRK